MLSSQTLRQLNVFVAVASAFVLTYFSLQVLGSFRTEGLAASREILLASILFAFSIPVLAAWIGFRRWAALPVVAAACFVNTLAIAVVRKGVFFLFYLFYLALYGLLGWFEKERQSRIWMDGADLEKNEGERNQLDIRLKELVTEIDASLAKYTTYYGLREVAERFATTMQLDKIAELAVTEARGFIPTGESYLLYLADVQGASLSLVASHLVKEDERVKAKKGDPLDGWVLKNRKHLLVADTKKDIFFDAKKMSEAENVRSVMIAPLVSEDRVVGLFRVNAATPDVFGVDDLRLLDVISDLACSAISSALLYQKTEELAIRDSLTGLYVQRYFKDRLKEEHRRALLTNSRLSILMCDLDHFKSYNDRFGHAAGDMILVRVAEIFAEEVGEDGIVSRYGGEEIACLVPRCTKESAVTLAEKVRRRVEKEQIEVRREPTQITVSIGVSTLPDDTLEREDLVRKADQNLYEAKRSGRNQVRS